MAGWKHFLITCVALAGLFIVAAVLGSGIGGQ